MPYTDPTKERVQYLLPRSLTGDIRLLARRLGVYPATIVESACRDHLARIKKSRRSASRRTG